MSKEKNKNKNKIPFYRKRKWRIALVLLGLLIIGGSGLVAYIYAQGSKIFDPGDNKTTFFRSLKSTIADGKTSLKSDSAGRTNILILGMGGAGHPGGNLTDSVMVLSINNLTSQVAMISLPRDIYAPIDNKKYSRKINEAYDIGEKDTKGSGPTVASETVSNILGLNINYYVTIDFDGFEKLIDEVGGIDVYVDKAINDPYFPDSKMVGYAPFYITAGQHHLDGKTALKYARSRETTSDFDRAGRQQKVIMALRNKILKLGFLANPKKLLDAFTIVSDHIRTSLSPTDLKTLAEFAKGIDTTKTITKVLTNDTNGPLYSDSSSGTYYLLPKVEDFSEIHQIAKNIFNEEVVESARIEITNGSTQTTASTKLSTILKAKGYTVVSSVNSKTATETTTIYDYTNGAKPNTSKYLQNLLGVAVVTKTPPKASYTAEFSIVIGNDYKAPSITTKQNTGSTSDSDYQNSTNATGN